LVSLANRPLLIGHEIYRYSSHGRGHPLAISRVSATLDLIAALGWHDPARFHTAPQATFDQLARFHEIDYLDALVRAEADQSLSEAERRRFNIGINGNPIYPEIFRRPATSCGGTLLAMSLLLQATDPLRIYHPAGGTHHGRPAQASGFCYLNDIALGIHALLDHGIGRIAYVDLDAHHGDGVEAAFADDPRVVTISVHEGDRWPRTGTLADQVPGSVHNFPMPTDLNDSEFSRVVGQGVVSLVSRHRPDVLVIQAGCDALADDPMTRLSLSNQALWQGLAALLPLASKVLVLGGGGYNPWAVARCWAGIWAVMDERSLPARLPEEAETVLRGLTWRRSQGRNPPSHWYNTLRDPARPGDIRQSVTDVIERVIGKGANA
jgi:acetoin utilization protein AcuC